MASEENEDLIHVESKDGNYVAVFDPLDGSSNIDVNISIGTHNFLLLLLLFSIFAGKYVLSPYRQCTGSIFGIYRRRTPSGPVKAEDVLQPGTALLAAGYVMYGSAV